MMEITTENFLLIGAILLFVAVLAGKVAYRLGTPALLLFLGVGIFFGYDILSFNSPELTQFMGMIALSIILFSGGYQIFRDSLCYAPRNNPCYGRRASYGADTWRIYLRNISIAWCRAELPARPTPCLNNGIYRLCLCILNSQNKEART